MEDAVMDILKERIMKDGVIREGNVLKVDSFLNHQMDIPLIEEIGREFKRRYEGEEITKILTIEASGIGIACITAQFFHVPVVFAKKSKTKNIAGPVYTTQVESYTHDRGNRRVRCQSDNGSAGKDRGFLRCTLRARRG